jgi:dipeptidyl aminopeptidase/acylaminoacyl peptidase
VDGERMGILGGSYGGWMANWVVTHSERFKAAVTMRSVSSMVSMFGASDIGFEMRHEFGGLVWEAREDYERQSPLMWAHKIKTPTLIIHSEQDLRCPMNQAQELYTVLKLCKVPTRLVLYPEESHDLSRDLM